MHLFRLRRLTAAGLLLLMALPVEAPVTSEYEQRAMGLIIPHVEMRDATLAEAVEFLRAKARALDPAGKALPVEILPAPWSKDRKINLTLQQISLGEALHYAAAQARLDVSYGPTGITLLAGPADHWRRLRMAPTAASRELEKRARAIKPRFEFREATFEEVVEFFRSKARATEPGDSDINIVNLDVPPSEADTARVTFGASNLSLFEGLQLIVQMYMGVLVAEPEALVIRMWTSAE
jgi:hypothetical protein